MENEIKIYILVPKNHHSCIVCLDFLLEIFFNQKKPICVQFSFLAIECTLII